MSMSRKFIQKCIDAKWSVSRGDIKKLKFFLIFIIFILNTVALIWYALNFNCHECRWFTLNTVPGTSPVVMKLIRYNCSPRECAKIYSNLLQVLRKGDKVRILHHQPKDYTQEARFSDKEFQVPIFKPICHFLVYCMYRNA